MHLINNLYSTAFEAAVQNDDLQKKHLSFIDYNSINKFLANNEFETLHTYLFLNLELNFTIDYERCKFIQVCFLQGK
jgi:hypothetical protein